MIRFTIATCTFNAEKCITPTLESVLSQTYRDVEHLIIDGKSTDSTMTLAARYKEKSDASECYHDVVLLSEPDEGLYHAMNKALTMATGDYIIFLNAGDTFPADDTLESISGMVGEEETLPAVIYGDTDIVDSEGKFLRHRRLSPPEDLTWRSFRHGMLVCHQAFYALTDIARSTPYDTAYRYSADFDWCLRIMKTAAKRGMSMKYTGSVVAHYLDGGMTEVHHRASLKERFRIMTHHYGLLPTLAMHAWFVLRSKLKK